MDHKEKLAELLYEATLIEGSGRDLCEKIAEHLIAHGVTVQQWIPVTERLPEKHKRVLTVSDNGNIDVDWVDKFGVWIGDIMSFDEVTHWMPLPEPPKEG